MNDAKDRIDPGRRKLLAGTAVTAAALAAGAAISAPAMATASTQLVGSHLDQGGSGGRMPLGFPALSDPQIKMINDWITAGAPNN